MNDYEEVELDSYKTLSDLSLLLYTYGYNMKCLYNGDDYYFLIGRDKRFSEYEKPLVIINREGWTQFYVAYPGDIGVNFAIKNKIPEGEITFTLESLFNGLCNTILPNVHSTGVITPVQYMEIREFEPEF